MTDLSSKPLRVHVVILNSILKVITGVFRTSHQLVDKKEWKYDKNKTVKLTNKSQPANGVRLCL